MAPKILVIGVTGGLGCSVLDTLLQRVHASSLAASSSNDARPDLLKTKGVDVNVPESLYEALSGIEKLFIVSTGEVNPGKRIKQHANVVKPAKAAGIAHIRIDLYIYADAFPVYLNWYPSSKEVSIPADGPAACASRAELGEATAKLMLRKGYEKQTVLSTGPKAYTFADIVETITKVAGKEIILHRVSAEEDVTKNARFDEGKKPAQFFEEWRSLVEGVADGEAAGIDPLMGKLLGRQPKHGLKVIEDLLKENRGYTWQQNYDV